VTVSLDPKETPDRLRAMKSRYMSQYGRPEAGEGAWTFLSGSDENIHAVARALGISYNYNESRDEYVHPAAFLIAAPDGTLSRYVYGLEYHPNTVRLSLIEASQGKVGSTMDRLILFCFHYDASEGRYAPVARNIMKVGGAVTAVSLAGLLFFLFRAERRRKAQDNSGGGSDLSQPSSTSKLASSVS
jgi:protein SCO1/2